jgi:ATP-dependent Clp protease ATP-binding subunit ClpB
MKNMTVNALEALQKAQNRAYEMGHAELEPLHLLWALLSEPGVASTVLRGLELDPHLVSSTAEKELASLPRVQVKDVPNPSRELQQVLLEAQSLAQKKSGGMVGTRELLLALAGDRGRAGSLLKTFNITPQHVARALETSGADQAYQGDDESEIGQGRESTSAPSPGRARSIP